MTPVLPALLATAVLPALLATATLALPAAAQAQAQAQAATYTVTGNVPLREAPSPGARVLATLDANETVVPLAPPRAGFTRVRVGADLEGHVASRALGDVRIEAHKAERALLLIAGTRVVARYRMALGARAPAGDKQRRGDGATPEGRFFIAEVDARPEAARHGARSLLLSYPNAEDARRGLAHGLVDYEGYLAIVRAVRAGQVPPQDTALGGSIRIHGGGGDRDWTAGCLALADADVRALFARVGRGTRVDVYASAEQARALGRPGHLGARVLRGAQEQLKNPALYTRRAMSVWPLAFPAGDIDAGQAVCADIVVRAARRADLDLQALVHEDRLLHPERYPVIAGAARASHQIDHRRVRNLERFFARRALRPTRAPERAGAADFLPGDIVVFEVGIANGTPFDHIGVVDERRDPDGYPRVINIWSVGAQTASMRLLGSDYPTVVAHFRLRHPFEYQ